MGDVPMSQQEQKDGLSVPERILRLQDQWDQIAGLPEDVELTAAQLAELERRLHDHRLGRRKYTTWEELRSELETADHDFD
jgi:putative addiction module component (TIGR02574 family)